MAWMLKMLRGVYLTLPMTFMLQSSAFSPGGAIPAKYTCEGQNISPPLQWSGVPQATRSYVLIVDDPDAPNPQAPQRTWVHWVLYDIPAETTEVRAGEVPEGAKLGRNDWNRYDYGGPCPPIGCHRYFHKLYALDRLMANSHEPTKDELLKAMEGHVLSEAVLIGTYQRTTKLAAR